MRTFNNQRKGIIKQGYLTKQGHIIRNWKKRSFVLMRDELKYYKSETEKKPQGKIKKHLGGCNYLIKPELSNELYTE